MKRILTAREQFDMLSPWMITAEILGPSFDKTKDTPAPGTMVFPVKTTVPEPEPISEMKMIGQPGEPLQGVNGPNPESRDAVNDPMGKLNNQRFSFEDMVNNLVSHFNGANEDQRKRGRFWYKKAHDDFAKIAAEAGISPQRAVAIGAAFSPLTDWSINLGHARNFVNLFRHRDPNFDPNDWTMAHIHPQALQAFRDVSGRDPSDSVEDIEALADMHYGLFKSGKNLDGVNDIVNNPKARQRWINNVRHHGMEKVLEDHANQVFANKSKEGGYSPTLSMRDYGIKTLGNNIGKAKAIMLAKEDPELFYQLLKGPKVGNFSQNILNDGPMDEEGYYIHPDGDWTQHADLGGTIDAHHMRASTMAHGAWQKKGYHGEEIDLGDEDDEEKKVKSGLSPSNPFTYSVFNNGLFEATKRINASIEDPRKHLTPKQVQAIIWIKHKEDNERFKRMRMKGPDGKWKAIGHESQITPEGIADYEKRMAQAKLRQQRKEQAAAAQQMVAGRFWQRQADAPRVLYRGIHLNPNVEPGQTGYIPPELRDIIRQHGLSSKQFADAFARSTWGTRFSPFKSVAESFAKQAPPGVPSAIIAVDWDGNDRAADPHAEMAQFPDGWFGGTRPQADPDPFQEVRLKPGKQLKVLSLQVRDPQEDQWKELLSGGPTVIRTATVRESGIQDDKYPQHWMDKAEQLARDTGGFTIHDDPTIPGDAPSTGYQVAIPGYERTDINTGQGWADYAHENQDALKGNYLGTWNDEEKFWTEPSQNFSDYDDAARATVERNQWSMWDNSAYRTNPQTGEKEFLPQADIPRHHIINQGLAGATGFTLAKNRKK